MRRNVVLVAGLAALGLWGGLASPVSASPITYGLITGPGSEITVSATISGGAFTNASILFDGSASWVLGLDSGSLTLDTSGPTLDSFSFGDSSTGADTISVQGGPTLGTLSLTNILVQSNATPDSPLTGTGPYGLSTSNVMDSANYSITLTSGTHNGSVSNSGTPLTGTITTGGNFTQTNTIQLGTMSVSVGGTSYTISLKGDTSFQGASTVPLPPSAWLLAGGLALLGLGWMRQRERATVRDLRMS